MILQYLFQAYKIIQYSNVQRQRKTETIPSEQRTWEKKVRYYLIILFIIEFSPFFALTLMLLPLSHNKRMHLESSKNNIISHIIHGFLFFIHWTNCCKDCILLSGCKNKVLGVDRDMDFFQLPFSLMREKLFWEYFSFNIQKLPSRKSNIVPICEKQSENCNLWWL